MVGIDGVLVKEWKLSRREKGTAQWQALSDEPVNAEDAKITKSMSRVWKMNIAKGHKTKEHTLCCPYCLGEGWIDNPGFEFRIRRLDAGLTQREFSEISGWSRGAIQGVERGLHQPNPHLVKEYRKLPRNVRY